MSQHNLASNLSNRPSSSKSGSWNVVQETIERVKHAEAVTGLVLSVWQAPLRQSYKMPGDAANAIVKVIEVMADIKMRKQ
jgi:hypothetical protein